MRPPGAKVILVVLENKNEQPARERPFLARLAREGRYLANYHAVAHPSQPNYIAMVSGSIEGVDRGDTNVTLNRCHLGKNLASWTVYAEGYPGGQDACYLSDHKPYVRKHVPFLSFADVNCDHEDCRQNCTTHIRDFREFASAARSRSLPDFSLVVPNLDNDGHDYQNERANDESLSNQALDVADKWLKDTFEPLLDDPHFRRDVILFVTFDENDDDFNLFGVYPSKNNKVYASVWGGHVIPGPEIITYYDHYDLHRTFEAILGVDARQNCNTVPGEYEPARNFAPVPIGGIWR